MSGLRSYSSHASSRSRFRRTDSEHLRHRHRRPSSSSQRGHSASEIPHGTIRSNGTGRCRSSARSRAWSRPGRPGSPMAAILRSGPRSSAGHPDAAAALDPGVVTPSSAQTAISASSRRRTWRRRRPVRQLQDRVADQLARAVPGDLAAAVDVDDRGAVERPLVGLGALARGVDRRVLEQQDGVRTVPRQPPRAAGAARPTPPGSRPRRRRTRPPQT